MATALTDIPLTRIDGSETSLGAMSGQVLLIVNVASKCGLTPQYEALEKLYEEKRDRGFAVLGFPSNQFAGQEPGSEAEIQEFCTSVYGVRFPMFAKLDVKGPDQHPLYKALTEARPERVPAPGREPKPGSEVSWNFEKFLVGRDGSVIERFAPQITPDDLIVVEAIETALAARA